MTKAKSNKDEAEARAAEARRARAASEAKGMRKERASREGDLAGRRGSELPRDTTDPGSILRHTRTHIHERTHTHTHSQEHNLNET